MRLAGLDLNLLPALHALLTERHVTRAAERMSLSQPSMSMALGRLRRHFGDELLYRVGNGYQLTALGMDLAGRTAGALDELDRIFSSRQEVDPATSTRRFVVQCTDYAAAVLGAGLSRSLRAQAPQVTVHLRHDATPDLRHDAVLRDLDGLVLPHGYLRDTPHVDLFRDRWVCLVSADDTSIGDELTMADLVRLPWVVYQGGTGFQSMAMRRLAALGVTVQVGTAVDSFLSVPHLVAGTGRIALVQQRLARLVPVEGTRVMASPFDAGPLREAFWWHRDFERDAEHAWFRELLREVARSTPRGG